MLVAGLWVPLYGEQVGQGWLYGQTISLSEKLGWGGSLLAVLATLAAFYIFVTWIEIKKK